MEQSELQPVTGERVWRFWTVPGPGEPGNDTWADDSWMTGGAGTWMTGAYDPHLNLVYWGTGNPGPDWNGDVRLGDNLYSSAVVALDVILASAWQELDLEKSALPELDS